MTVTKQSIAELQDILAIQLDCQTCHATVKLRMDDFRTVPTNCPNCNDVWFTRGSKELDNLGLFQEAVVGLRKPKDSKSPVRFTVELSVSE